MESIHITSPASFSPEKNIVVWKDKNGLIKQKYGFITFLLVSNNIKKSSCTQMLIIYIEKNIKVGIK